MEMTDERFALAERGRARLFDGVPPGADGHAPHGCSQPSIDDMKQLRATGGSARCLLARPSTSFSGQPCLTSGGRAR
jgi:hypothetical protein